MFGLTNNNKKKNKKYDIELFSKNAFLFFIWFIK